MPAPTTINTERGSTRNAVASVDVCSRNLTREKIEELRQQGIEVNDDNDPAPENVPQSKDPPPPVNGTWEEPTHCPRRANNIQDRSRTFVNHRWDEIADYNELQFFRMCFPEEWLVNVCIPMTNKELSKKTACLLGVHLLHGVLSRNSGTGVVVVYKADRHVRMHPLPSECLHDLFTLSRDPPSHPLHGQGRASLLPRQVPRGQANDRCFY